MATLQTVGSSGGLKVGADFIRRWLPGAEVWVSDPTWDNHRAMFEGAGLAVHAYPYYDVQTGGLRFAANAKYTDSYVVTNPAIWGNAPGVPLERLERAMPKFAALAEEFGLKK